MKLVILLCFVALATAAELPPVAIVRQVMESNDDGSYTNNFETENGIKVAESGKLKQIDAENAGMASSGSYSYTAPDGTVITTNWVADENGFRAFGDHLPTPPPMPEHVVKLLADLKAAGVL